MPGDADAPLLVRYCEWQQRSPVAFLCSWFVATLLAIMLFGGAGFAAASCTFVALDVVSGWQWRTWLRQRIRAIVADRGEVPGRQLVNRLAPIYRADVVRKEIARLCREGYLEQAGQGVLRPSTLF